MVDRNAVISKYLELIKTHDYFMKLRDEKFNTIGKVTIDKFIEYMKRKGYSIKEEEVLITATKAVEKVFLHDPRMELGRYFTISSYVNADLSVGIKLELTTIDEADLFVNQIMFKGYNLLDNKEFNMSINNFLTCDLQTMLDLAIKYEKTIVHMEKNEFIFLGFDGITKYDDIDIVLETYF